MPFLVFKNTTISITEFSKVLLETKKFLNDLEAYKSTTDAFNIPKIFLEL